MLFIFRPDRDQYVEIIHELVIKNSTMSVKNETHGETHQVILL